MTIHSDIDKVFKEGLAEYSHKAPAFVWDNIESNLNRKRIRKRRNMLYGIAASVAIILSFGAGYLFFGVTQKLPANFAVSTIHPEIQPVTIVNETQNHKNESNQLANQVELQVNSKKGGSTKHVQIEKSKKIASAEVIDTPVYNSESTYNADPVYNDQIVATQSVEDNSVSTEMSFAEAMALEEAAIKAENSDNEDKVLTQVEVQKILEGYQMEISEETPVVLSPDGKSKWSVGVSASPLVSYRSVMNVEGDAIKSADNLASVESKYQNEKPLVSYSAGLDVNYKVSRRWSISSGIYRSEIGQVSANIPLENQSPLYDVYKGKYSIHTSTGNIVVEGTPNELIYMIEPEASLKGGFMNSSPDNQNANQGVSADFVQSYSYFEIPVVLNYTLIDKKVNLNFSGGLSANFLSGQDTYVMSDNTKYNIDAEVKDIEKVGYSGLVGLCLGVPLVEKLNLNVQPLLRYSLTPINRTKTVYPYSFGLYTGVKYIF